MAEAKVEMILTMMVDVFVVKIEYVLEDGYWVCIWYDLGNKKRTLMNGGNVGGDEEKEGREEENDKSKG